MVGCRQRETLASPQPCEGSDEDDRAVLFRGGCANAGGHRLGGGELHALIPLRHFPELERALRGVKNPFAPWVRAGTA